MQKYERDNEEYYKAEEVEDKINMLEDALADVNEDNSILKATSDILENEVLQLKGVLKEIRDTARAALL